MIVFINMKHGFIIFVLVITITLLCSCNGTGSFDGVPSGAVEVQYTIPEASSRSTTETDTLIPNELIIIDFSSENPQTKYYPVQPGNNAVQVNEKGLFLFSFVYNPAAPKGISARSTASAIATIGNLQIVSAGLDSLPLNTPESDRISLGDLSFDSAAHSATAEPETEQIDSLGFSSDALGFIGKFDQHASKLANPDIDRDGRYDSEQGMEWQFQITAYWHTPRRISYNFDTAEITTPLSEFYASDYTYVISTRSGFPHPDKSLVRLDLPPESGAADSTGNTVSSLTPYWSQPEQYYFMTNGTLDYSHSKPPFDGDYVLDLDGTPYYFNNMRFPKSADNYEGFVFPIYHLEMQNDYFDKLHVKWMVVENGSFEQASLEEIYLQLGGTPNFAVFWEVEVSESGNQNISAETGEINPVMEIDLSSYGIGYGDYTAFCSDYRDITGNQNFSLIVRNDEWVNGEFLGLINQ